MSIEAMQQALEALQNIHPGNMTPMAEEAWDKAIASLRQAIEQAEKAQPVAWIWTQYDISNDLYVKKIIDCEELQNWHGMDLIPLYTVPPPRQPLTEEEIKSIVEKCGIDTQFIAHTSALIARAIEAAHGIKE
jgi:hypothetical protein